jgi:hypothetical protein
MKYKDKKIQEKSESAKVARVYKRKNARVKKALSFTTPRDRSKLA